MFADERRGRRKVEVHPAPLWVLGKEISSVTVGPPKLGNAMEMV